jgi:hypothetical protein
MQDWIAILATPRFRSFWLALLSNNLGRWCVMATLPILVAERFGAGGALVLSLGLRILPELLLAPVSGVLLRRFGPGRVASLAMVGMGALTALLPLSRSFAGMQGLIAAIGTLDVFVLPGLLSLRGQVTPPGLEMAGNTLCSVADRLAKFAGPALGGLVVLAGLTPGFLVFGAATALAAIPVALLPRPEADTAPSGHRGGGRVVALLHDVRSTLRGQGEVGGLMIVAVSYMVMLGGLRPFLFWANRDWFDASDTAWTGLLAAQGLGALVGALVSGLFGRRLLRLMSAYRFSLWTGLAEGALHLALLFAGTAAQAMALLALAGIPEILSTATWFTAFQERLSPPRQAMLFAVMRPMWDGAYALGVMSAGLHAGGALSLGGYWALVSLASTLPIVPLLLLEHRRRA